MCDFGIRACLFLCNKFIKLACESIGSVGINQGISVLANVNVFGLRNKYVVGADLVMADDFAVEGDQGVFQIRCSCTVSNPVCTTEFIGGVSIRPAKVSEMND
ncbi:MAG: hypothetical protein OXF20_04490 [Gammaproteobacteria bacterium]|nr:hypothetical protein [Gammaproteobacteria bacterium]